ncbi:4 TM domain-containing transmembrane protein [Acrasis kona]|uniref:4 TM domain-containing transmembrane protein n=1 Tax=Acrasis kona TaxID=1008807 RepID=A0AAW2ZB30_9EUKA
MSRLGSPSSPKQGMEDEEELLMEEKAMTLTKPQEHSATKSEQLTTLTLVLSTILFVYSAYLVFSSLIYLIDWLSEWRTDAFRWARFIQSIIGCAFALVSLIGVQSAFASVPSVRQLALNQRLLTCLSVLLIIQTLFTVGAVTKVACDGISGLKHPSVKNTVQALVGLAAIGGVLTFASIMRGRDLKSNGQEQQLENV